MKKILKMLFFLLSFGLKSAVAQKLTLSFSDTSLSDVLKEIDMSQKKVRVQFMYDELEDFRVSIRVEDKSVEDAVRAVCGYYPVSIRKNGGTIFVECLQKAKQKYTGYVVGSTTSLQRRKEKENLGLLQDTPLPRANVTLLHPVDSLPMVQGVSNEDGFFVVPCDEPEAIIRISHVGYETHYKHCKGGEVGQVRMKPSVKNIPEITIDQETAYLPIVRLDKPGTLSSILSPEQQDTLTMLSLSGKVNSADIRTLRHMAGYEEENCRTGKLKWLDLRDVEFVTDKNPYLVLDATEEKIVGFIQQVFQNSHSHDGLECYIQPTNVFVFGDTIASYIKGETAYYGIRYKKKSEETNQNKILENGFEDTSSQKNLEIKKRKWIKRRKMQKISGHRILKTERRCQWEAYLRKGHYCYDTFCACPNIQIIVLPKNVKIDEKVQIFENQIKYYVAK